MRIAQLVSSFSIGDAVSNSAANLGEVFQKLGYSTKIFAEHIHPDASKSAVNLAKFNPKQWDAVLYHFAFQSPIADKILSWKSIKKYILYHNVTPSHFFRGYDEGIREACKNAREQLAMLKDSIDCAFAVSNYNAAELKAIGYKQVELMPIWFDSKLNLQESDPAVEKRLTDGKVNFLFVGRLTPHKCQHDLIKVFYGYQKTINPNCRLILVGSALEVYVNQLRQMVKKLDLKDVLITGHITDKQLAAYYRYSDIFLSMSEHEGFCVPLLEAMNFELPIVAFDAAAIGETLGDAGIKLKNKDFRLVSELVHEIVTNEVIKTDMIEKQNRRLLDFSAAAVEKIIVESLRKANFVIEGVGKDT